MINILKSINKQNFSFKVKTLSIDDFVEELNKEVQLFEKYLIKGYYGNSYKTVWHIRDNYKEKYEIVTIPFHPGLSIIKKSTKQLFWI